MIRSLTVIVLAGGKGTRMESPLPKVCHLLGGRPLIAHLLTSVQSLAPERTMVIVGYRAQDVITTVGSQGFSDIEFITQHKQDGTGHAVQCALGALKNLLDFMGDVVVLYGDTPFLSRETLQCLLAEHRASGAAGTFATAIIPDGGTYGRVTRDSQGHPTSVVEARNASETELRLREINVGAYCFRQPPLARALAHVTRNSLTREYYLTDVIGILAATGESLATITLADPDEMRGINTQAELRAAEDRLARQSFKSRVSFINA